MLRFISLLAGASLALAQQYSISTVAGGAPPATPAAAAGVSIGQPARVALDAAGNLYFSGSNCVFKINGTGTVTLVAGNSRAGFSGDGGLAVNAQLNAPQGIAFAPGGNVLYIADSRNNRIRQVDLSSGIMTTFAGTGVVSPGGGPGAYGDGGPATSAQLHLPMGVAVDSTFNVYIADTGDNTIRKVSADGNIATIAGDSFPSYQGDAGLAITAELHGPEDVAVDSSGNVYIADTGNAYVRKVTSDGNINFIAGDGSIGFTGDGGYATSAGLIAPFALALDSSGNVYIAENGDIRIRKIDVKSLNISTVVGNGTPGFSGDGSDSTKAQMNSPTGVAVDSAGNLYIADSLNLRIRKTSGGSISTFAGNGTFSYSGDGGPAVKAQLNTPQGVAADAAGNLFVADTLNNVVRKVSPTGTISNYAGNGGAGNAGDGSAATAAQLNGPQGLAVDAAGNLFIADTLNAKVRKVSTGGVIATVAGSGTPGFGGDGGAAASAQLNLPSGVAVDSTGNLYIADFGNSRVRKVAASGGAISTVAGNGSAGYSGDGGPAAKAQLNGPQGVAVDAAGNLYIADTGNNLIREVTADGRIASVAGNGIAGYSGDGGPATSAQVGNPVALAVDAVGNIYIVDATRVRQIYPNGLIATIAGDGSRGYSGDGGLATQAQLNTPSAIALGKNGNLYVADTANNAVRLLQYTGSGLSIGAVTNAASSTSGAVAPGEVVVLYGSGLGPARLTQSQLDPTTGLVGTNLAGTRVVFNGTPAPMLYTSATQIAAVAPYGIAGSNVQVFVEYQGQPSAPVTLPVAAVAPALFTQDSSGKGQAAASNQDGTLNGAAHPAKVGTYISLWLTGAGQTNPAGADGQPGAAPLPKPVAPVAVTIGGTPAAVQFAGQAPNTVAGVMQINAQVPSGLQPGDAVPVLVQVGSVSTQAGVTVAVGN